MADGFFSDRSSMFARVISRLATLLAGLVLGMVVIEVALRFIELRPAEQGGADTYRRMHYIYTETGLGKCYPTDPRRYLPYDLRSDDGYARLGSIVSEVADVPDTWPVAKMVDYLRDNAPFCNNIELARLNGGRYPERPRKVLIVGDSFAFGEGLRLEDTIGYRLAEHFPDVNFPNMAWPGSSIDNVLDPVRTPPDVDTVLYFFNINDIARTDALVRRRDALHDTIRDATVSGENLAAAAASPYCHYSRLCWMLHLRKWEAQRSQASIDYYRDLYFSAENEAPRTRTFERISKMKSELARRSIRFVVVMFPLYYKAPFSEYPFAGIHDLVETELQSRGVEFLDLLPAYNGYWSWYEFTVHPLDRHPSAKAIDVAAEYLAGHLRFDDSSR